MPGMTSPDAETTPTAAPGLRGNRRYQLVWFSGAISMLGDVVFTTGVVLWVGAFIAKGQTWAPLAVSGVLVSAMVPTVLLGPIGGVYADRWNRRRVMLVCDLVRAAVIGALILLPTFGQDLHIAVKLTLIYAVVAVESAFAQFFNPARFALLGTVVADADRERAGSLGQGTQAITSIIGPPLAAPLLVSAQSGVQWALLADALSFVASFFAVLAIKVTRAEVVPGASTGGRTAMQDFRAGLRFVGRNRTLRLIIIAIVMVTFGAGAINVLDLFFVTRNLHLSPSLYGLMDAAFGSGLVVGAIVFAILGGRIGAARVFSYGLMLGGIGIAAYSRSTVLWVALLMLFLTAVPVSGVNAMAGPLLFRETPKEMVGRVIGVINPVQEVASFASIAVATWLASTVLRNLDAHVLGVHFGTIDTIFFAGGIVIAATGAWAVVALRGVGTVTGPAAEAPTVTEALEATVPPADLGRALADEANGDSAPAITSEPVAPAGAGALTAPTGADAAAQPPRQSTAEESRQQA
jgi:MFS family permease